MRRGSKSRTKRKQTSDSEKAFERFVERSSNERITWLRRPRLHPAIFAQVLRDEQLATKCESERIFVPDDIKRLWAERKAEIQATARQLDWSDERLSTFQKLVAAYREEPSAQNYLRVRQMFPEVQIQIGQFGGIDPLFALEDEFKRKGIDPQFVSGALDGDEPSVDSLSLRLLVLLAARDSIPKSGPGHLNKRRNAISNAIVDYLIVTMLEALDWHDEIFRVPASLIVLIRLRLCGIMPDLHAAYILKEKQQNVAVAIAEVLKPTERLSARKLSAMAGIPRSTAARWLKSKNFKTILESAQEWANHGGLKRPIV